MNITWRPFALRPIFDGAPFEFSGSYVEKAWRRASSLATPDGLAFTMWPHTEFPRWSLPGLEAGVAAQKQDEALFLRFHVALYRAFFVDNKNLLERDTLVTVARDVGLSINEFVSDLEDPGFREMVRRQCEEAADSYFVSAVPTVLIGPTRRQIGMVDQQAYLSDLAACGLS